MRLQKLLLAGGLLLGALAVAGTVYASLRYYISVAFEDQWQTIAELAGNHGVYSMKLLWSQHNEHRQPFSRLVQMADLYWFRGQNVSLFLEIYLLQAAHLGLLVWALRRFTAWPGWLVGMASGVACFALFCTIQWESFLNPVQGCYMAVFLCASVSLLALLRASEAPVWTAVSIAAAFVAEGNLANGLLAWPLMLVAAVRLRVRVVPVAVAAVVGVGLYLVGYHKVPWHADPMESAGKPLLVVRYLLVYFGSAWARISLPMGQVFAAVGVVAAVGCYAWELLRPVPKRFAVFALSFSMFMLGTGLMTALGRLHQLSSTVPSRYQTASLLFWLGLGLYAIESADRRRLQVAAAVLLFAMGIAPSLPSALQGAKDKANQVNAGALPVLADVNDRDAMKAIYPDPQLILDVSHLLREHNTAFYADARYRMLGSSLGGRFAIAPPGRCAGSIDKIRRVADSQLPGWEVVGHSSGGLIQRFVAANSQGAISGSGIAVEPGVGWRVYVQALPAKVYGIVDGGKAACLVASTPLPARAAQAVRLPRSAE